MSINDNFMEEKKHHIYRKFPELKPILDKIYLRSPEDQKHRLINIHHLHNKHFVKEDDVFNIAFKMEGYHFEYLMEEGFSIMYDPTDECYLITWR